jgi:cytochrome c-type biogenesis protein CcmF
MILNHWFEYHYAWSHSSKSLPKQYIISAFWEGQEGSFLLWTFWNAFLGLLLIRTAKTFEAPVMALLSGVQIMLASMLLGVYILGYKVGSSPFILLRHAMPEAPFLQTPDYLQSIKDGNGLNPLLQNPWMVIHPPVLFLGFASVVVPFCYAIAALWRREWKNWTAPAQPWALFSVGVLGVGIMMGGAWAYESLSFGGYWAWDPVENASLMPWLTLVAGTHTLLAYKRTGHAVGSTFILLPISFVLVLYATFLTRSGVLGDSSVHSFTDLGMSGQLLVFLFGFLGLTIFFLVRNWKAMPFSKKEESTYSREFWMFIGSLILVVSCFQIIATTSIPVYNKIFGTSIAPPADAIGHYNRWQAPIAIIIVALTVFGQSAKYKGMAAKAFWKSLLIPAVVAAVLTGSLQYGARFTEWDYIALLFACFFSIAGNADLLIQHLTKIRLHGGAVAHIGFALMLIGVILSGARKQIISLNTQGVDFGKEFNEKNTKENVLLWRDTPLQMGRYEVTYLGDSTVEPNIYYKVRYRRFENNELKEQFVLTPNAQVNPKMGLIASPDTRHYALSDVYTHVSQVPSREAANATPEFEKEEKFFVTDNDPDTFTFERAQIIYKGLTVVPEKEKAKVADADFSAAAQVDVVTLEGTRTIYPIWGLAGNSPLVFDAFDEKAGVKVWISNINPKTQQIELSIAKMIPKPKDYIIMKAIVFPYINVLWGGTFIMAIGFTMATIQRQKERKALERRAQVA